MLAALVVSACAGDGPPLPAGTTTTITTSTTLAGGSLLGTLQQDVFTPSCALGGCHDAATQFQNLDLSSSEASYNDLVGVASACIKTRVVPGDVDASYLVDKVGDGDPFCGTIMPQVVPELTNAQKQLIRDWIEQGAPPAGGGLALEPETTSTSVTQPVATTATTATSSSTTTVTQ